MVITIVDVICISTSIIVWIMVLWFFFKMFHLVSGLTNNDPPQEYELEEMTLPPTINNPEIYRSESNINGIGMA